MSMRGIDFGAVAEFGVGFSTSSVRKGVIFATGVRRESRTCHPTERGVSPKALLLVEHIGGGSQQSAQLIGEEAAATGAVDFQAVVQLFDAVLDVGAVAVDRRVQMARG